MGRIGDRSRLEVKAVDDLIAFPRLFKAFKHFQHPTEDFVEQLLHSEQLRRWSQIGELPDLHRPLL